MKCIDNKLSIETVNDRVVRFVLKELSGEELEGFQLHLLECDCCNKRALAGLKVEYVLQKFVQIEKDTLPDVVDIILSVLSLPGMTREKFEIIKNSIEEAVKADQDIEVHESLKDLKAIIEKSYKQETKKELKEFSRKPEYKQIISIIQELLSKDI